MRKPAASVAKFTRTTGDTAENIVYDGACILYGVYPELTTTGTITIRNNRTAAGGTPALMHICAIGLLQSGKTFGPLGMLFPTGLTVQLSVASDLSAVVWYPAR